MVVRMIGCANLAHPAMDHTFMAAPSFERKVFFDTFEKGTKLPVFFFYVISLLVGQANIKPDDLNPTVIRLKVDQLVVNSVEYVDVATPTH